MIPIDSKSAMNNAQQASYMDLKDLQSIRKEGLHDKDAALAKIAKQFESIMLHSMLKSMRESNAAFSEDSMFDSSEMQFHQEMFDQQLSLRLSQGRGLGIAESFLRQMKQQYSHPNSNGIHTNEPMPLEKTFTLPESAASGLPNSEIPMSALLADDSIDATSTDPFARDFLVAQRSLAMSPIQQVNLSTASLSTASSSTLLNSTSLTASPFISAPSSKPLAMRYGDVTEKSETPVSPVLVEESGTGTKQAIAITPEDFIEKVKPYAEQAAQKLGIDSRVLIAQAALETGWGRHVIHRDSGESSFNLFNIKASEEWKQDKVVVSTLEFDGTVAKQEQAQFRVYQNMADSFEDYTQFIGEKPRYANAIAQGDNPYRYLQELQHAGYATDPEYAKKVWNVYRSDLVQGATSHTVMARNE